MRENINKAYNLITSGTIVLSIFLHFLMYFLDVPFFLSFFLSFFLYSQHMRSHPNMGYYPRNMHQHHAMQGAGARDKGAQECTSSRTNARTNSRTQPLDLKQQKLLTHTILKHRTTDRQLNQILMTLEQHIIDTYVK